MARGKLDLGEWDEDEKPATVGRLDLGEWDEDEIPRPEAHGGLAGPVMDALSGAYGGMAANVADAVAPLSAQATSSLDRASADAAIEHAQLMRARKARAADLARDQGLLGAAAKRGLGAVGDVYGALVDSAPIGWVAEKAADAGGAIASGVRGVLGMPEPDQRDGYAAASNLAELAAGGSRSQIAALAAAGSAAAQARDDAAEAKRAWDEAPRVPDVLGGGRLVQGPMGVPTVATGDKPPALESGWSAPLAVGGAILDAVTAGGHAIEDYATDGRGYARYYKDSLEAMREGRESFKPVGHGLPLAARMLFGQDGEDAMLWTLGAASGVVLDPINLVGGPGLNAIGAAKKGLALARAGHAAGLAAHGAFDVERAAWKLGKARRAAGVSATELERAAELGAKLPQLPGVEETLAQQVRAKTRTLGTIAGLEVESIPGMRKVSEAIHEGASKVGRSIKASLGPVYSKQLGMDFRVRSLLSDGEQDALVLAAFKGKQLARLQELVEQAWHKDAKGLEGARARFNRGTGNEEEAQRRALLKVFEEGPGDELRRRVNLAADQGDISRDEGAYLLRVRKRMEEMKRLEQSKGVPLTALNEAELTYLHHATTQEWRDALAKVYPAELPHRRAELFLDELKNAIQPGHTKSRAWNLGVLEANEAAPDLLRRRAKANGVHLDSVPDMFHTDMPTIEAARRLSSNRAVSAAELLSGMGHAFGVKIDRLAPVPAGYMRLADEALGKMRIEGMGRLGDVELPEGMGRLGDVRPRAGGEWNVVVPKDIGLLMTRFSGIGDPEKGMFGAGWDAYQKWWKTWTLQPRPSFHARNVGGSKIMSWMENALDPRAEWLAWRHVYHGESKTGAKVWRDGEALDVDEMREAARNLGVLGGKIGDDLASMETRVKRTLDSDGSPWKDMRNLATGRGAKDATDRTKRIAQAWVPLTTSDTARSLVLRPMAATGELLDQQAKLSHFIARVLKGDTYEEAALSVKRALFDYGELTKAEREGIGRAAFFYSWMRNNLEFQAHVLKTRPGKIARKERAIEAIRDGGEGESESIPVELFPSYQQKAGLARYGKVKDGRVTVYTRSSYDPTWDLTRLGDIEDGIGGQLAPPLQAFMGLATGRNPWRDQDLSGMRFPAPGARGANEEFFGSAMPSRDKFVLEKLLPGGVTELWRLGVFGGTAPNKQTKTKGAPPIVGLVPGYPRAEVRDRLDPPLRHRLAQYLLGMRPYQVDLWAEGRRRVASDLRAATESVAAARKQGERGAAEEEKRLTLQAAELRARAEETKAKYAAHGIKLDTAQVPLVVGED